ncbi:hypothetical protein GCM10010360_32190 [Streptomyces nogalater]
MRRSGAVAGRLDSRRTTRAPGRECAPGPPPGSRPEGPRACQDRSGACPDGWGERLRVLVGDADGALVPRRIHALPVGHRWDRAPGATLPGDAAHLMSPFVGEGANLALLDGAELGLALAAHPGDTEAAPAAYEARMFPRAEASAAESARGHELLFAADAPRGLVETFTGEAG